jgi:hypothetical protein
MMIDGIKSFAAGLATGRPVMSIETVHELTDRIINPRPPKKETPAPPHPAEPAPEPRAPWEEQTVPPPQMSRARTIFNASEEAKPFNPAELDFAMLDERPAVQTPPASIRETSPAQPLPRPTPQSKRKRILGMTLPQFIFVAALALAFLCLLVAFAILYFAGPSFLLP